MNESDVRKNLRDAWGTKRNRLIWVEQARGSTVGAPDVFIPRPNGLFFPLELKCWPSEGGIVYGHIRSSQLSFHSRHAIAHNYSGFLVGVTNGKLGPICDHMFIPGPFVVALCLAHGNRRFQFPFSGTAQYLKRIGPKLKMSRLSIVCTDSLLWDNSERSLHEVRTKQDD